MVYWVILRPECGPDERRGPGPAGGPAAVERLGPFESRERAERACSAKAERAGCRQHQHWQRSPAVRPEIVCDYA